MINWQWPSRQVELWRSSKIWSFVETISLQPKSILHDEEQLTHNEQVISSAEAIRTELSHVGGTGVDDHVLEQLSSHAVKDGIVLAAGEWVLKTKKQTESTVAWTEMEIQPNDQVTFQYQQHAEQPNWQIRVMIFHVGAGAILDIESEVISPDSKTINIWVINQQENSKVFFRQQHIDFLYQREHVWVHLLGEEAHTEMTGLYAASEKKVCEQIWTVSHQKSHTTSVQKMRGILTDRAHAVAISQVEVIPGIMKVDSVQKFDHILLSPRATVHTRPQLEILSDDVICQHGVTVGELDEAALFYLQSRGIDRETAVKALLYCFFEQIWWSKLSLAMRRVIKQIFSAKEKAAHDQLPQ